MTRNEARQVINTEGQQHTLVVYFTKRDGSERRMVCRSYAKLSRKPYLITVWDLEKGADRAINLDTVREIKVLRGREDRPAMPPKREVPQRTFEDARREMRELFY